MKPFVRKILFTLAVLALMSTGCDLNVSTDGGQTTNQAGFSTATLPPTATHNPTVTPAPPTEIPTVEPVEGATTTQINVRAIPDKTGAVLGMLDPGERVQIIGKDASGGWWLIIYSSASSNSGWVAIEFVRAEDTTKIPVVGASTTSTSLTPVATPSGGLEGKTSQKINVRSGPGTSYNTLGIIENTQSVTITGKNGTGTWLQIFYPGGPGDRGWASAAFIQTGDVSGLPELNDEGTPVPSTSGTGDATQPAVTQTIAPAAEDGDTAQSPAVSVTFSPKTSRQFIYTSDVSLPQGDLEDWLQLVPYSPKAGQTATLDASLKCSGNGTITVELLKDGAPVEDWGSLACGDQTKLDLSGDATYLFHLSAAEGSGGLQYILYTFSIKVGQ